MSINVADELVILLIFVNNEHFVNAVTMRKCQHATGAYQQGHRGLHKMPEGMRALQANVEHFEYLV